MSMWNHILTCKVEGCKNRIDGQGHHNKHQATFGSDGPWNRIGLCRQHHTILHQIGRVAFIEKFPETKYLFDRAERIEKLWQDMESGIKKEEDFTEQEKKDWNHILYCRKHFGRR